MNDTSRPERRSGWLREPLLHFLLLGAGIFEQLISWGFLRLVLLVFVLLILWYLGRF